MQDINFADVRKVLCQLSDLILPLRDGDLQLIGLAMQRCRGLISTVW